MDIEEILLQCLLCPGACTPSCPVYLGTRYTPSRPVNIARTLYRGLAKGDEKYLVTSGYCSLCDRCREACPVGNDLPSVIRIARRRLGDARARKLGEEAIYMPSPEAGEAVLPGMRLKIIDTWSMYRAVSYGWMERYRLQAGYSEDVDVHTGPYTIELLEKIDIKIPIGRYMLHIPCKMDRGYIERFRRVFGREEGILERCMGGGGLDLIAPKLLRMIPRPGTDIPVLTQCGRAAIKMRSMGLEAYTPLEVYLCGTR